MRSRFASAVLLTATLLAPLPFANTVHAYPGCPIVGGVPAPCTWPKPPVIGCAPPVFASIPAPIAVTQTDVTAPPLAGSGERYQEPAPRALGGR